MDTIAYIENGILYVHRTSFIEWVQNGTLLYFKNGKGVIYDNVHFEEVIARLEKGESVYTFEKIGKPITRLFKGKKSLQEELL